MKRKIPILFIFLALLALMTANFDYVCGHLSENPCTTHICPLCSAFHAADLSPHSLEALVENGFRCIRRFIPVDPLLSISEAVLTSYTLRAPPQTAV